MDAKASRRSASSLVSTDHEEDQMDLRRGPWTVEEDITLINYIAHHGEGRWNSLALSAGLKRSGKSCRLRWLNYLRPDVRRGNITLEEQLLILELHSRWGNRWSKIAQYLPGRTDNEIKNYWRTRVQKHAKQLKCDVNSKQFKDKMRYLWMPRLVERIQVASASASTTNATEGSPGVCAATTSTAAAVTSASDNYFRHHNQFTNNLMGSHMSQVSYTPENSSTAATTTSSDSFAAQVSPAASDFADQYTLPIFENPNPDYNFKVDNNNHVTVEDSFNSPTGYFNYGTSSGFPISMDDQHQNNNVTDWLDSGETSDNVWNVENIWSLQHQQQLNSNV